MTRTVSWNLFRCANLLVQSCGVRAAPSAWTVLATYVRPQWTRTVWLACLVVATIGLQLANPQLLRLFIDTATRQATLEPLVGIAVLFLAVALTTQVLSIAETYVAENIGLTATNALRAQLTLHCLRLDPDFHNSHTPGELIERIDGDVSTLANFFSRFVVYVVGNGLLLIGVLVLLFLLDWRIGLPLGVAVTLAFVAVSRLRDIAVPRWTAARQASAELYGFLEERLAGTEDIRASGATRYVMYRFFERSRRLLYRELLALGLGNLGFQVATALLATGSAVALGVGAYLFLSGALSVGTVYVIFAYTQALYQPMDQIARHMQDLQQAGAGLRRIQQLFALRSTLPSGTRALPAGPLSVEFQHVWFGYVADEPVLRDLSLRLEPGEILGVVGRTGIGKSTFGKLLVRLHQPDRGRICIAGTLLSDVAEDNLRQRVGLVTQEIQLFHATVRDNLSLFDRAIDDDLMRSVLEELGLGEWLNRQPHGLDTMLQPGGAGMSAGESQLLAFARVFLRDPGLIILDEASSRLDPATEQRIDRAIVRLLEGRTGVIIAHRPATLRRVHRTLSIEIDQGAAIA